MEPLEQVTVLMTLMKRLVQVMDHERAVLKGMRLDALPDLQDEKWRSPRPTRSRSPAAPQARDAHVARAARAHPAARRHARSRRA